MDSLTCCFDQYYELINVRVAPAVETFAGISCPEYDPELREAFVRR